MTLLQDSEIADFVSRSPWKRDGDQLLRSHKAESARQAIEQFAAIAEAAEEAQHHPELTWVYDRLELTLSTHDEGGITERDVALAQRIDAILESK